MDVEQLRFTNKFKFDVSDLLEFIHREAALLQQFSSCTLFNSFSRLHFASKPVPLPGPKPPLLHAQQHPARLDHQHQGQQPGGAQHLTFDRSKHTVMWRFSLQRRGLHSSSGLMKTMKSKTPAEQRWLQRQLKDPYVKASHAQHFRCRSAFKLLEIDDKFRLLQPGRSVVDCGAAPGAWSQVAVRRVNSAGTDPALPRGAVVGVDLLNIPPLDGAHFLSSHDVTDPATHAKLQELLPAGRAHVILSDMAPNASGFREMDHEILVTMCLSLADLAERVLQPGGALVCKYWDGILARTLQEKLSRAFGRVQTLKPNASRKESAERYFLARMYGKRSAGF